MFRIGTEGRFCFKKLLTIRFVAKFKGLVKKIMLQHLFIKDYNAETLICVNVIVLVNKIRPAVNCNADSQFANSKPAAATHL